MLLCAIGARGAVVTVVLQPINRTTAPDNRKRRFGQPGRHCRLCTAKGDGEQRARDTVRGAVAKLSDPLALHFSVVRIQHAHQAVM